MSLLYFIKSCWRVRLELKVWRVCCFPELVTELHPRKPQLVEQKVLPLFWTLLSSSCNGGNVRTATAKLAEALHSHMGQTLVENAAATQPANVQSDLNELLRAAQSTWTQTDASHSAWLCRMWINTRVSQSDDLPFCTFMVPWAIVSLYRM